MSYTNREFNWDFDALKRFYNNYVIAWINTAMAWTNTQVARARANVGGTVDVSLLNASGGTPQPYASLTAALADVPSAYQRGGMEVQYIDSTTHKYVKYRLMATSWSTSVSDWQGVDNEPTAGSDNLVKSGSVFAKLEETKDDIDNELKHYANVEDSPKDLEIVDDLGNVIQRLSNGHIKTKNFDSENVYTKEEVDAKDNSLKVDVEALDSRMDITPYESGQTPSDFEIADEVGNVVAKYHDGIHETKFPSPYTKEAQSVSDFEFTDKQGNSIFRVKDGYPQTKNFDGKKISPNALAQATSYIGRGQMRVSYPTISTAEKIELLNFPKYLDTRKFFSFIGYMPEFPANAHFDFGIRYKYNNQYWHDGAWIRISATTVELYQDSNEDQSTLLQTNTHGLSLSTFVKVFFYLRDDYSWYIILETLSGMYVIEFAGGTEKEIVGHPYLLNSGIEFSNVQLTAGSADFKSPIWIFGDSYSTASYGYTRLGQQLMDLGLTVNTCYDHLGGNNHQNAWDDLQLMLNFGTPRMIVWLLGVNGSQPNNVVITSQLKALCEQKGIELVLEYPPKYPNVVGIDTTNLRNAVLATGCRIVDFSKAVGCDDSGSDVTWYSGYLSGDNIHPTELGSRALVMQIINDVPELLQWGVNENPQYYSANNN